LSGGLVWSGLVCVLYSTFGKERVCVFGKERVCVFGKERVCVFGKEREKSMLGNKCWKLECVWKEHSSW
jgi:hypothetical protein